MDVKRECGPAFIRFFVGAICLFEKIRQVAHAFDLALDLRPLADSATATRVDPGYSLKPKKLSYSLKPRWSLEEPPTNNAYVVQDATTTTHHLFGLSQDKRQKH